MRRFRFLVIALAILLAGFSLRLALYDVHGLEGDDAFSLAVSRHEVGRLIPGLLALELDVHPPLHFLALKGWTTIAGDSLLSLRLMNVLLDLLTGAILIRLTGRVFTRQAALVAGLLWSVAPLLLFADLLVRMYTLLAFWVTADAWCLVEARRGHPVLWYSVAAICALGAMYSHVLGVVALATLGLALIADMALKQVRLRHGLAGLGLLMLAGVLYLPFALPVLDLYRSGHPLGAQFSPVRFAGTLEVYGTLLTTMLAHRVLNSGLTGFAAVLLFALGSRALWGRYRGRVASLLAVAWASWVIMGMLAWITEFYKPRYLAAFAPITLAVVAGIVTVMMEHGRTQRAASLRWRLLPLLLLLGLLLLSGWGIVADLGSQWRDDWVTAAHFLEQHERPGDAIVIMPDWGEEAWSYHYRGAAPVHVFPLTRVTADFDFGAILQALVEGYERIWLLRYQPEVTDRDDLALTWFRERAILVTQVYPSSIEVSYFDFAPQMEALPEDVRPVEANFGGVAALRGVYLPVERGSARDTRLHPPSNWVQVVLYWQTLQIGAEFVPRVRLTDAYGQVYGAVVEREDNLLRRMPVSTWQAGQLYEVSYDLNLNPMTLPGVYNIEVMVLNAATGEPLRATGADAGEFWVIAGQFVVE